ncbi:TonB-dependent siderophore receptor [Maricaulis sp.]|uniref:TonB-dependent receptor plug domain-containing protein n=1 Tax=Maricaulis sp. TaxID=1486257 RepID=UPI001B119650|nr:TonB-dependent receptor [Maricaulis sp.]MBO6764149.1 TonB-dependent receptor [Maricaulis sp.]
MSTYWDRERLLRSTILAGFAAAGLAISPAYAQDQQQDEDEQSEDTAASEDTIVVTGSRIRRDAFASVAPLQVIDSQEIRDAGLIDTAQILQTSSVAQGVQLDNTIGGAFVTDAGPGSNTITLRGLNPDQTLLLINGRRVAPSGVEGAPSLPNVDIIPTDAIQRIDILLDGASSVYGSDAVAGVVNVILRDNFEGFQVGAYTNSPEESGGGSHRWNMMVGDSSENGRFMFSMEYFHQDSLQVNDRDWNYDPTDGLYCSRDIEIADDGSLLSECEGAIINRVRTYNYFVNGQPDLASYYANPGLYGTDVYSTPGSSDTGIPGWSFGDSTNEAYRSSYLDQTTDIIPDSQRYSFLFTGDYTIDRFLGQENVTVFTELLHTNSQTTYKSGYHGQLFPTVRADNPYNPFGFDVVPIFASPIERSNIEVETQYTRFMSGLQGDWSFAPSWSYEVFGGYTRSMGYSRRPAVDEGLLTAVVATTRVENGEIVCGSDDNSTIELFGFLSPNNCVPVNLFHPNLYPNDGSTAPSFGTQEEYDFLRIDRTATTVVDQLIFGGFTTGPLFELPAGEVSGVFGIEWRRDTLDSGTDTVAADGLAAGYFADRRSEGSAQLTEYYAELAIPLVSGARFAEDISLELAGRLTDHEYYGQNSTYSARASWVMTDFLTLNATMGTSFRAPNLRELFLGGQTGFTSGFADPCVVPNDARGPGNTYDPTNDNRDAVVLANCVAEGVDPTSLGLTGTPSIESFRAGNPSLEPETSDAYSLGFVFDQPFTDRFDASLRVSYFSIEVEDSIAIPGTAFSLGQCYNSTNFPNDPFCARRQRDPNTGLLTFVDNTPFNVATQETTGWDFNGRFNMDFNFLGGFNYDMNATFTKSDEILSRNTAESDLNNFVGDWGSPEWRGAISNRFERGDWSMLWRARYLGEQASIRNVVGVDYGERIEAASELGGDAVDSWDAVWYHDLSISYDQDTWAVTFGVNNLFNEEPAIIDQDASGATLGSGNEVLGSGYDLLGRRFFARVSKAW